MAKHEVTYGPIEQDYLEWEAAKEVDQKMEYEKDPEQTQVIAQAILKEKPRKKVIRLKIPYRVIEYEQVRESITAFTWDYHMDEEKIVSSEGIAQSYRVGLDQLPSHPQTEIYRAGESTFQSFGRIKALKTVKKGVTTRKVSKRKITKHP